MIDDLLHPRPLHPADLHSSSATVTLIERTTQAGAREAALEYDSVSLRHKGTDSRTLGEHLAATNVAQTVRFMRSGCLNFSQDREKLRNTPRSGTERGQRCDPGRYGGLTDMSSWTVRPSNG